MRVVVPHACGCTCIWLHTRGCAAWCCTRVVLQQPPHRGGVCVGGSGCTCVLHSLYVPVHACSRVCTVPCWVLEPSRLPRGGGGQQREPSGGAVRGVGGWGAPQHEAPGPPSGSSRARAAEPPPGAGVGAGSPGRALAGRGCPQAPSAPPPAGGPHVCGHACSPPPRRGREQEPPLRVPAAPPGAAAGLGVPRGRWAPGPAPLAAGSRGSPGGGSAGPGGSCGAASGSRRARGGRCGAVRVARLPPAAPAAALRGTRTPASRTSPHHPGARGPAGGTGRPGQRRPLGSGWARGAPCGTQAGRGCPQAAGTLWPAAHGVPRGEPRTRTGELPGQRPPLGAAGAGCRWPAAPPEPRVRLSPKSWELRGCGQGCGHHPACGGPCAGRGGESRSCGS